MKLLLTLLLILPPMARAAIFTNTPSDKDAFVRALAPGLSYGGGGALSISGTNATVNNPTNGAFDSFLSFNTHAMAANFNTVFGAGNWVITGATLVLTQNPAPGNPVFNSGNGNFQIRWIANDTWAEGTGTPMAPTTDGVTFNDEAALLNSNADLNLGIYNFTSGASPMSCTLSLPNRFVTNLAAGGEVGFFLTAADPNIGFVFYSHNFKGNPIVLPQLIVTAVAPPVIASIHPSGSNLFLTCSNAVPEAAYRTLAANDLNIPVNQWLPVQTNMAPKSGVFSITLTNAMGRFGAGQFFVLSTGSQ